MCMKYYNDLIDLIFHLYGFPTLLIFFLTRGSEEKEWRRRSGGEEQGNMKENKDECGGGGGGLAGPLQRVPRLLSKIQSLNSFFPFVLVF